MTTARHIPDHRALLPAPVTGAGGAPPALDAVIVPSARCAASIHESATVARDAGAVLVVLCSKQSRSDQVRAVAGRHLPGERVAAVDVLQGQVAGRRWLRAERIDTGEPSTRDTGAKRNLGIRLALSMGWRQVLFLDDDVTAPRAHVIRAASARLGARGGPGAVGWAFEEFPDNSLVCHAHRLAGGRQGTFVGAGGLLLRVDQRLPHFPGVYNEDWLFFADLMVRRHRGLAFGGTLRQKAFDPFADPAHARRQEFGDVLGEGLFALLHRRTPLSAATSSGYWADYLNVRSSFLADVEQRLLDSRAVPPARLPRARVPGSGEPRLADLSRLHRALEGVSVARHTLAQHRRDWELDLPAYVRAWRQDAVVWNRMLSRTTSAATDLDDALGRLGLSRSSALPAHRELGGARMPRSIATVTARVRSSTSSLVNTLSR